MRFSHRLLWHALGLAFASTQCSALSLENLHFEFPNAMYTVQQNGESYRVALKDTTRMTIGETLWEEIRRLFFR